VCQFFVKWSLLAFSQTTLAAVCVPTLYFGTRVLVAPARNLKDTAEFVQNGGISPSISGIFFADSSVIEKVEEPTLHP
jgi:hypothetical protein